MDSNVGIRMMNRMLEDTVEDVDFVYQCNADTSISCPIECQGLEECLDCQCAVVPLEGGGPWGEIMDVIMCLLPIVFLIVVTIKPNPLPTTQSLPFSAIIMFLVRLMYLGSDPILTCASVILGLHEALTPLSIMAGAITLFETMEATNCLPYMMREMKALTAGHPVAELMLIFAFAYMIEGASGFGTPVALGAPMLVSTGNEALPSVVVLLIMNTFATVWGAVGTPIWFGFDGLFGDDEEYQEEQFLKISYQASIALGFGTFILMPFVLAIMVPFKTIRKNIVFVYASLCTVLGPSIGISFGSYEFPSLMGGLIGCMGTAILIRCKIGLSPLEPDDLEEDRDALDIGSVSPHSIVNSYHSSKQKHSHGSMGNGSSNNGNSKKNKKNYKVMDSFQTLDSVPEIGSNGGEKIEVSMMLDAETHSIVEDDDDEEEEENGEKTSKTTNIAIGSDLDPKPTNENGNNQGDSSLIRPIQPNEITLQDTVDLELGERKEFGEGYIKELILRTFPIWAVVLLLILTRVSQIGLKDVLTQREPNFSINFGTYGIFQLSASLVFQLSNILTFPGLNWKYELLYLPFFMPFTLVAIFTMILFRKDMKVHPKVIASTVAGRLYNPAFALLGALSLVQLLIRIDTVAPAYILGSVLAKWLKQAFIVFSPLLGALGSFFSGSTTVSNLTFGQIQVIAAESIGTSPATMLALQAVGASAGNGICLNNIIAACAVVGLNIGEGQILAKTYKFVLASTTISTAVLLAFFFRFD